MGSVLSVSSRGYISLVCRFFSWIRVLFFHLRLGTFVDKICSNFVSLASFTLLDGFFFLIFVLPSPQHLGFLVLILPCYSFYPCVLLPSRVPFLGVFFFSLSCFFFPLFVLLDSVGSCLHAHTFLTLFLDRSGHGHTHALTIETYVCTHVHPDDAPLWPPSLAHGDTPITASAATVAIPASSQLLEGVIQVGKKPEGKSD